MISLRAVYGNKLFDRKTAYANARYIPFIASCLIDIVIALSIISIFDVHWDYAFLKVYGLLLLFGVIKYIFSLLIGIINYRLIVRNSLTFEMKHYLNLPNPGLCHVVSWGYSDIEQRSPIVTSESTFVGAL